jgi:uncharacterized protein YmfQ (DUF2313 family)
MLILNTSSKSCTSAENCTRIDLAGGFAGYGVQVVRRHTIRHCLHVCFYRVRETGKRHMCVNIRAFGRNLFCSGY